MTPKKAASSDAGHQPTISSFFSQKTTPVKNAASQPPAPEAPVQISSQSSDGYSIIDLTDFQESPPAKKRKLDESAKEEPAATGAGASAKSKPSFDISPFFRQKPDPKPSQSSDEAKRRRAEAIAKAVNPARHVLSKYKAPPVDSLAAGPRPSDSTDIVVPDSQAVPSQRHHEWERRLNDPRGLVPRRRSFNLEEAAAKSVRAQENGQLGPDVIEQEDDPEAEIEEVVEAKSTAIKGNKAKSKKSKEDVGPSGLAYTPLEKQYMTIKAANPDVLILFEVGYKFQFFEEDAKIASKELGIAAFPKRNFWSASIPTHRLDVHVKKLVEQGHLVGVVRQTETAALKAAGDNRNKPFERELTNLYTAATYVEGSSTAANNGVVGAAQTEHLTQASNAFVCLNEDLRGGLGADDKVRITLVAVYVQTGEVIYDEFDDGFLRNELETRFAHISPAEILLPEGTLSKQTEKLIKNIKGATRNGPRIRIERRPFESYNEGSKTVERFCTKATDTFDIDAPHASLESIADLSKSLTVVIAAAMAHLDRFNLVEPLTHLATYSRFSERAHMILSANTLINLEVFRNNTDHREKGSLLWILDHTKTQMGKRLLREWLGRPLNNVKLISERLEAIEEILTKDSVTLEKLRGLLKGLPDLGRGLARITYGKTTPRETKELLFAFKRLAEEFEADGPVTGMPSSELLQRIVTSLPRIRAPVQQFLSAINPKAAHDDDIANLFVDAGMYPKIQAGKDAIRVSEEKLKSHLADVRVSVKRGVGYTTNAGIEYLIEMKQKERVPDDWIKVQSTKHFVRYHTPCVLDNLRKLEQARESLQLACTQAFQHFQRSIATEFQTLRDAVIRLAEWDCLQSLAIAASNQGYSKPAFVQERQLVIKDGRHPMAEAIAEEFVPNSIEFSADGNRTLCITGPNTSGKSTCVRATALILVMAQIGSFVPADSVRLSVHDAVYTRMGASDDLARGKSTFMVELTESAEILQLATNRSLIILDELGRGTSTSDGSAIAFAVLQQLIEIGSHNFFVTHYPQIASESAALHPQEVGCYRMSFSEADEDIVCLYKLVPGLATKSFGVWVGKLAGLPKNVLDRAQEKGDELKAIMQAGKRARRLVHMSEATKMTPLKLDATLEQVASIMKENDL